MLEVGRARVAEEVLVGEAFDVDETVAPGVVVTEFEIEEELEEGDCSDDCV